MLLALAVVVLLVMVLVLSSLGCVLLSLVILLVRLSGLLVALLLVLLTLVLCLICAGLTIVRGICCLSVLGPLAMLFLNLFADIVLVAFLRPVHALFFGVLILALFFAFFIVCFTSTHIL